MLTNPRKNMNIRNETKNHTEIIDKYGLLQKHGKQEFINISLMDYIELRQDVNSNHWIVTIGKYGHQGKIPIVIHTHQAYEKANHDMEFLKSSMSHNT